MQDFKYENKAVKFFTLTGDVISQHKRDETSVHTVGGGGYVGQHGGYVSAPQVYSSSTTHHDIWIKPDDGKETCIRLVGCDIPVREGQRITTVYAKLKGEDSGYPALVFNHTVRRHWAVRTGEKLNSVLGIAKEIPWLRRAFFVSLIAGLLGAACLYSVEAVCSSVAGHCSMEYIDPLGPVFMTLFCGFFGLVLVLNKENIESNSGDWKGFFLTLRDVLLCLVPPVVLNLPSIMKDQGIIILLLALAFLPLFFISRSWLRAKNISKMEKKLEAHLEEIARQLHKQPPQEPS